MRFRSVRYLLLVFLFILSVLMLGACSEAPENTQKGSPEKPAEPAAAVEPQPVEPLPAIPDDEAPDMAAAAPDMKPVVENEISMEIIPMKSDVYDEHTRGIVMFPHEKHFTTLEIGCGECHHDARGNPLNDITLTDTIDTCGACHSKPGNAPKPKEGETLSMEEKLSYHAEALHESCITCHRGRNAATGTRTAPTGCVACHPKEG